MDRKTFRDELVAQIQRATKQGRDHIEVNAGELHRTVGGFPPEPGGKHAMHICCMVLRSELARGKASVIHEGVKAEAYALTIRYDLPRPPRVKSEPEDSEEEPGPSILDSHDDEDSSKWREPLESVLLKPAVAREAEKA